MVVQLRAGLQVHGVLQQAGDVHHRGVAGEGLVLLEALVAGGGLHQQLLHEEQHGLGEAGAAAGPVALARLHKYKFAQQQQLKICTNTGTNLHK